MDELPDNDKVVRSCLGVKPPYGKRGFRHMMKF